ncbi:MAG: RluA family pseudouridine synthase [Rhodospirillaceae bacterium]|nr:RluA family pseudouridine synthase [Rhodospirillaceae bacterium]MBT7957437.1 RluA family pseudouridine synthase [Rhodospirillaceae bacterium]
MNNPKNAQILNATVKDKFSGSRLDKFLAENFAEHSRSRIKSLIVDGYVTTAGAKVTDPSRRVKPGEKFELSIPALKPAIPVGQKIDLNIVYEDQDLIIIDKPAGLVVHPAPGNPDRTLVNALIAHCGDSLSGIGGEARPGIVHRLDKDTSGLMVAAKNDIAHRGLAQQFSDHSLDRAYKAVVWGVPKTKAGKIEGNIGRNPRNRKKMAVVKRGGKHALTHYQVEKRIGSTNEKWAGLVECRLSTGRTHQIRVHLTSIGHPIIGDPIYGSKDAKKLGNNVSEAFQKAVNNLNRQALHAFLIGFIHPTSGQKISFESPLSSDILTLL